MFLCVLSYKTQNNQTEVISKLRREQPDAATWPDEEFLMSCNKMSWCDLVFKMVTRHGSGFCAL